MSAPLSTKGRLLVFLAKGREVARLKRNDEARGGHEAEAMEWDDEWRFLCRAFHLVEAGPDEPTPEQISTAARASVVPSHSVQQQRAAALSNSATPASPTGQSAGAITGTVGYACPGGRDAASPVSTQRKVPVSAPARAAAGGAKPGGTR